jgi:RHS repeat-associated protein
MRGDSLNWNTSHSNINKYILNKSPIPITKDYTPFGSVMNGRSWSNENYRFGFNGKELDPEGMGGGGSTYDYGFRIYNAQLGKFLSVDPLTVSYPWYTPYQFAGNKVIEAIDIDGLEEFLVHKFYLTNSQDKPFLYSIYFKKIPPGNRIDDTPNRVYEFGKASKYSDKRDLVGIIRQHWNTLISKKRLTSEKKEGKFVDYNSNIIQEFNINGVGTAMVFESPTLYLENDQGNDVPAMTKAIEANKRMEELVDNVASILINDKSISITITGSASSKATNVDGTSKETTVKNNELLAQNRANSGEIVLRHVLKDKYKQSDDQINSLMTRVKKESKVQGTESDSSETQSKQRYIEYKINVK